MDPTRRALLTALPAGAALLAAPLRRWRIVDPGQDQDAVPAPAPRVAAFERLAYGLFVHWGLYSLWEQGEWTLRNHALSPDAYFARMEEFRAERFSGRDLARLAKRAGMRYVTLTTRHHDGFSLYDTGGLSPLDITATPAGRDLVLDFVRGCRAEGIVPMLYHTTLDWTDPRFEADFPAYLAYLRASLERLCTAYGPIGGFWFDGNWSRPEADWEEDALYRVIRTHQPGAMILNNTGIGAGGALGHPEIDSTTFERGRPEPIDRRGHPKYVAGEMCHTLNFHWGRAARDFNYLSPAHVIEELCSCRRAGANLLLNVGPDGSGSVPDYEQATLARVGEWVRLHADAADPMNGWLYRGRPAGIVGEGRDFGLRRGDDVYLFVFDLAAPADTRAHGESRGPGPRAFAGLDGDFSGARWLDNGEELSLERRGDGRLVLQATGYPYGTNTVVRVAKLVSRA